MGQFAFSTCCIQVAKNVTACETTNDAFSKSSPQNDFVLTYMLFETKKNMFNL